MTMRLLALAALLAAGGCSEPDENVPAVENAAPVGERTPVATPTAAASPVATATLPQPLLGAWTADTTGDCTSDNELRINILPDRIDYHESRATITSVTQVDPHSWGIDADLSGEGESWKKSFDLNLNEDGSMTRVEAKIPDIRYTRCPEGTQ